MRYVATIEVCIFTDDRLEQKRSDRQAKRKAADLASQLRSKDDNEAKVVSVYQSSWGSMESREVEK